MLRQHPTYSRIHVDGFAEGPVPEEVYREVFGPGGPGLARATEYEGAVFRLVDTIDSRRVGRCVLRHLNRVGGANGIVILPASLFPRNEEETTQNATWPTRPRDAYAAGGRVPGSSQPGTGRGSPIRISFRLNQAGQCSFAGSGDAVLLHELVHAIRVITGTQQYWELRLYDRFEEFVAVTLSNMYLSEIGSPLRDGHGCDRMLQDLDSFRRIYGPALARLRQDLKNAALYRELGALPAPPVSWNPLRGWR